MRKISESLMCFEWDSPKAQDSIDRIFKSGFRFWLPGICAKGVHTFAAMTGKEKAALLATLKDSLRKRYPHAE